MKFTVNRHQFLERLSSVNKAINPNSSLVALSGTKVDVFKDHIVLTGSDNNLTIRSEIWPGELTALQITEPGSLVMDFRYVLEILRRMDGEMLQLETIDNNLIRITDTSGEYNLNTLDASDYPNINMQTPVQEINLPGRILKQIYSQTAYATAEKDVRPILTGINFNYRDGRLTCTATDSYRLARKIIEADLGEEPFSITIPRKTLQEVIRMAEDDEIVNIHYDKHRIQFLFNKNLVQSQLLEGRFPDVEAIIPKDAISSLEANAVELERILERSTIFRDENASFMITMKLAGDENEITSETPQLGSSSQTLVQASYTGEPMTISLNGKFMLQAIQALKSQGQIRLDFKSDIKPIVITDTEDTGQDTGVTMIVVPMRPAI